MAIEHPARKHRVGGAVQAADLDDEIDNIYRWLKLLKVALEAPTFPPTAHNILSASHGDATVAAAVNGDILIRSGGKWIRFAIGTNNQLLTVVAGAPAWDDPGQWDVVTNGDGNNPEPVFDSNGDVVMAYTP